MEIGVGFLVRLKQNNGSSTGYKQQRTKLELGLQVESAGLLPVKRGWNNTSRYRKRLVTTAMILGKKTVSSVLSAGSCKYAAISLTVTFCGSHCSRKAKQNCVGCFFALVRSSGSLAAVSVDTKVATRHTGTRLAVSKRQRSKVRLQWLTRTWWPRADQHADKTAQGKDGDTNVRRRVASTGTGVQKHE